MLKFALSLSLLVFHFESLAAMPEICSNNKIPFVKDLESLNGVGLKPEPLGQNWMLSAGADKDGSKMAICFKKPTTPRCKMENRFPA